MTTASISTPPTSTGPPTTRRKDSSSLSVVAWVANQELGYPEWATAGQRLGAMGRCGQWGLGDWIQYGNAKFGERYALAARITGYDVQTLMNMVYVASRFEISRRRENLSWSHHEAVAALDLAEQERWLDRAVADRLSVSDLRVELRHARRSSKEGKKQPTPDRNVVICPNCGVQVSLGRRAAASPLGEHHV
jgi:hypothetical protein